MIDYECEIVYECLDRAMHHDKLWKKRDGGWRSVEFIKEECTLTYNNTISCLIMLINLGVVKNKIETLSNGTVIKFYRANY